MKREDVICVWVLWRIGEYANEGLLQTSASPTGPVSFPESNAYMQWVHKKTDGVFGIGVDG